MRRKRPFMYSIFGKMGKNTARYVVIITAFLGLFIYGVFTNSILNRLRKYSRATTETYAHLISEALFNKMGAMAEGVILSEIPSDFDIPIIITDMLGRPQIWENIYVGHLFWRHKIPENDNTFRTRLLLMKKAEDMSREFRPKLVYGRDKKTKMAMLYYGESNFIYDIWLVPFFELGFILFFILAIYYVAYAFLKTEKSNIWVGLAKETAHQLGTPLSSLMGWIEYLRLECNSSDDFSFDFENDDDLKEKILNVTTDMRRDIERLNKVTARFSQIGSMPVRTMGDVKELLDDHLSYFSKRLPTLGKSVEIKYSADELPKALFNTELLSWVFENLFKNSLDALDKNWGVITVSAKYISVDKVIRIKHRDNGKGISWDNRNAVFTAGFSTKTRGWGLGLTLARRIVEEYHHGRIYISWSQKGEGTEFTVELPVKEEERGI